MVPTRRLSLLIILLLIPFTGQARGQTVSGGPPGQPGRPRVGLVLAGGGARGGAHVGVLKVLEERHIPIDVIAGTSIGAVVGAMYAAGVPVADLETLLEQTDWDDTLRDDQRRRDRPFRQKVDDERYPNGAELRFNKGRLVLPEGALSGQKLNFLLRQQLVSVPGHLSFDALPIPFRAVATNIETGDRVVLQEGDLALAARASMAIPAFFSPVKWPTSDGRTLLLTDGGTASNLPVDVARSMGADIVIAIDISTPLGGRDTLNSLIGIASQTSGLLTQLNVKQQLATLTGRDVLVTPTLDDIGMLEFGKFAKARVRGEEAARRVLTDDPSSGLAVDERAWDAWRARREAFHQVPVIGQVSVDVPEGIDKRLVEHRVQLAPSAAGAIDWAELKRDLARIYAIGDFETVGFRVDAPANGEGHTLVLTGTAAPPAPQRVRLGLVVDTDFSTDTEFVIRLGLNRTRVNALRGELRTRLDLGARNGIAGEFYQPLDLGGRVFVAPSGSYRRYAEYRYEDGSAVERVRTDEAVVGLDAGVSLGSLGELRAGLWRARLDLRSEVPAARRSDPDQTAQVTAVRVRAAFDRLDTVMIPRSGWDAHGQWSHTIDALGGEQRYTTLVMDGRVARSRGETTVALAAAADLHLGSVPRPAWDVATAGGFLNLSGLEPRQLTGEHAFVGKALLYHRLVKPISFLGSGLYAGGSLEFGGAWNSGQFADAVRPAGAGFLAADTALGPVSLGCGLTRGPSRSCYLSLGVALK